METLTTTKWGVDVTHSEVQFKVKHLVIATVTGFFRKFDGSVESESEDFDGAKVNFNIDVNSIDTNQTDRDTHLKSADFFAADQFPEIKFSNGTLAKRGDEYELTGDITIRETTKPITLGVEFGGVMTDPYGNVKAGFEITGKISRKEFGLNWNAVTEAGGVVVGDDVKLNINIELVKG
jgi:polyisoprenoid-binding protein YceI